MSELLDPFDAEERFDNPIRDTETFLMQKIYRTLPYQKQITVDIWIAKGATVTFAFKCIGIKADACRR